MPEISTDALIVAIQAVAAQVREMRIAARSDDAEPEELMLLEEWTEAAEDLERAYDVEARTILNLPPYDQLVGG